MSKPHVMLRLQDDLRQFNPEEEVRGTISVTGCRPVDVKAIEYSVLWYTEGKGEEDLGVHFFERVGRDDGTTIDIQRPREFATTLPHRPLSYNGVIVKVRWCARVRVFLTDGEQLNAEQRFALGHVPAARMVSR